MYSDSSLEKLYNPEKTVEVIELHRNAFNWVPQGQIPLGLHVVNPRHAENIDYTDWLSPAPYLDYQKKILADTLAVGSDLMPCVALNHMGHAPLTTMFGAELFMPSDGGTSLQDIGATPIPVFNSIKEVESLQMPDMDSGIMPKIREFVRYYRENLPDWVYIAPPMPAGPLSTAIQLRGSEMLLEIVEEPELCQKLMDICAHLQAEIVNEVKQIAGTPREMHITNFGILGAGVRMGDDSIVNLSPAMIKEFCTPGYKAVAEACGGSGHIHFCSLPHSRFEHVFSAFADMPEVFVVSSQFGFEYYQNNLDNLRGRLAVESFYGDAYSYILQKYGSFKDWANDFVPRFKDESGLVLYCQVSSVEEGKEVWNAWQEAHRK